MLGAQLSSYVTDRTAVFEAQSQDIAQDFAGFAWDKQRKPTGKGVLESPVSLECWSWKCVSHL